MVTLIRKIKDLGGKLSYILTTRQKLYGALVVIISLVSVVLETLGVSAIVPLVNALLEPEKLRDNKYFSILFQDLGVTSDRQIIIVVVIGVIILYLVKNVFFIFTSWIRLKYSYKVQRECSIRMYSSYLNRGYPFYLNHNVNELMHGASGDITGLYSVISHLLQIFSQFSVIVFILIYMMYTDWQISIGMIVSAMICLTIIYLVFKSKMRESGIELRKNAIKTNKVLLESFNGIKEVLVMRKQPFFIETYEESIIKKQKYQVRQGMGVESPAYIIEAICITGIMSVLCFRILNLTNAESFVATLAAFAIGAFRILPGLGRISVSINGITSCIPNINAIYENVKEADRIAKDLQDEKDVSAELILRRQSGDFECIDVRNVGFSYDADRLENVLEDINIKVHRGQSVALVGETGAGKSTLADIILGLLKPTAGSVELDGTDIRRIPDEWAELVGFVPQSIYLADSSIRSNIAFGVREEEIDDKRVEEALKDADIWDFIGTLPDGVETVVGERGTRLSGGQCQRVGIARALYRRPQILVLDEATSALDNDTERVVMEAIERLHGRMTMIIIAHRLTTIKNCDKIYEIKDKHAYETTYDQL